MRQALRLAMRIGSASAPVISTNASTSAPSALLLTGHPRLPELHTRQLARFSSWHNPFGKRSPRFPWTHFSAYSTGKQLAFDFCDPWVVAGTAKDAASGAAQYAADTAQYAVDTANAAAEKAKKVGKPIASGPALHCLSLTSCPWHGCSATSPCSPYLPVLPLLPR